MLSSIFGRRDDEDKVKQAGRLPPGQSLTNRFPVLHYGPIPRFNPATWNLRVFGEIEQEVSWNWNEFNQLPRSSKITMDLHCVTRWSKFDTEWEGVSLKSLVDAGMIKLKPTAHYLMQHCEYGFTVNVPLDVALAPNFLLATHFDGKPLEPDHGYPLRGVVGHIPGANHTTPYLWKGGKWLRQLEFMAHDRLGFWEQAGYHNEADVWKESGLPETGRGQSVHLRVYADARELAVAAAELAAGDATRSIAEKGVFNFLLSGGSTPQHVYQRLAQAAYRRWVDWSGVHFFWGDERCVPPEHAESNYKAALESMILHLPVPGRNIHRIHAELGAEQAAGLYEQEILAHFAGIRVGQEPRFDLVFLGLGDDGHTASLFPGSPALEDKQHWVAAVQHDTPPPPLVDRVTATFRLLNLARRLVVLVSGASKAQILRAALESGQRADKQLAGKQLADKQGTGVSLPVQRVRPLEGELIWMVDESAAMGLHAGT